MDKNVKEISSKDMRILPVRTFEGQCSVCGVMHDAGDPHKKNSLFYQMSFYQQNDRYPTWEDAMSHCSDEIKGFWETQLRIRGELL